MAESHFAEIESMRKQLKSQAKQIETMAIALYAARADVDELLSYVYGVLRPAHEKPRKDGAK